MGVERSHHHHLSYVYYVAYLITARMINFSLSLSWQPRVQDTQPQTFKCGAHSLNYDAFVLYFKKGQRERENVNLDIFCGL